MMYLQQQTIEKVVCFVDMDIEYTDTIKNEKRRAAVSPEFNKTDKQSFTDFFDKSLPYKYRLSKRMICDWSDKSTHYTQ